MNARTRAALVVALMTLTAWVWTRPQSLGVTADMADELVRARLRVRISQEVAQAPPAARGAAAIDARLAEWIAQHPTQFDADKQAAATQLRSELSYTDADGHEHPYLGDVDSYTWIREARNYLRHGTTCDAVVDGLCRDTYTHAPVGARMAYNRSLHIAAIVALHTLITWFQPHYPLPATSMLVPVIVATLGVLPAFAIGRCLAGDLGGLVAAVTIMTNPNFLTRSLGSDNDVWNIVLPLYMTWAAMAALRAADTRRRLALATLAGAFAALHAASWRGSVLTWTVLAVALCSNAAFLALRHLMAARPAPATRRRGTRAPATAAPEGPRLWRAAEVQAAALVAATFLLSTALFTAIAGAEQPYTAFVPNVGAASDPADGGLWPGTLGTVTELVKTNLSTIAAASGGPLMLLAELLGMLLLLLPAERWTRAHLALLLGGLAVYGWLLTTAALHQTLVVCIVAVPLLAALFLDLLHPRLAHPGVVLIVMVWALAGLHVAHNGMRFVFLSAAPFGIALAVSAGRLYAWLSAYVPRLTHRYAWAVTATLFVLCSGVLVQPVQRGYATARHYSPAMNDAWWDTLVKIRDHAAPDAIVNTWWDYGYWVKYVAERRVSADGSSLLTHLPFWIGRALGAATERESVGLLRMLNCGSDAMPQPEGHLGAYGKILAKTHDGVSAQEMVIDLAKLDATAAAAYLAQHGFTDAEQADVLASTHCTPPESYLIISTEQTRKDAWLRLGSWDFRRAYIARQAEHRPSGDVVADIVRRFGYTQEQAMALDARARTDTRDELAGPTLAAASPLWYACTPGNDATVMHCGLHLADKMTGNILDEFSYDAALPRFGRFRFRPSQGGRIAGTESEGTPTTLVVAGPQQMERFNFDAPTNGDLGVLIDLPNRRIFLAAPSFIRSTFTHLLYLDGRYARHFEKYDERVSSLGQRVVTWRINWQGL